MATSRPPPIAQRQRIKKLLAEEEAKLKKYDEGLKND
jgi:hypothetical protein